MARNKYRLPFCKKMAEQIGNCMRFARAGRALHKNRRCMFNLPDNLHLLSISQFGQQNLLILKRRLFGLCPCLYRTAVNCTVFVPFATIMVKVAKNAAHRRWNLRALS